MDTKANTDEAITMNNLEKWVKNRFTHTTLASVGNEKNPIALAPYGESQKEHDDRQKEFHEKANEKSISDLEIITEYLPKQLEKLRNKIYQQACGVLQLTKDQKDKSTYKLAKDRIICWLLSSTAKPFSESSMGSWIKPLKNEYFDIEADETGGTLEIKIDDFELHQAVAYLNEYRENWIHTAEKLNIAHKAIHAKINDLPLTYGYLRAEKSYTKLNKFGRRVIFSPFIYSSEDLPENNPEKQMDKKNLCQEIAKELKAKDKSGRGYRINSYAFAFEVRLEHPKIDNMSKLACIINGEKPNKNGTHLNPPEEIKKRKPNSEVIGNWINHFDSATGI